MRRRYALQAAVLLVAAGGVSYVAATASQPRPLANQICFSAGPFTVLSVTVNEQVGGCVPSPV